MALATRTRSTMSSESASGTRNDRNFPLLQAFGLLCFVTLILVLVFVFKPYEQLWPDEEYEFDGVASEDDNGDQLLSLMIVFRHGQRTPLMSYHGDHYQNYSWMEGFGQLTNHGKERMYRYGQLLRKRYKVYLGAVTKESLSHH